MSPSDSRSLPAAARLLVQARDPGVVLVGGETGRPPPAHVAALLCEPMTAGTFPAGAVGAVVPVEARASEPDPLAVGTDRVDRRTRREVAGTHLGLVAVAPGGLEGLRLDPRLDDPVAVARAVVRHVRARGGRVLADPAWTVDLHPHGGAEPLVEAPPDSDILVVTGFLSGSATQTEDHLVFDLVRSLTEQIVDGSLTVLLTDGLRSEGQVARLRANGVEVVVPPVDTAGWLRSRVGRFSHAILTPSGLHSAIRAGLARTQPQAAQILYLPALAFREVGALAPLIPAPEQPSLDYVRASVETRTVELVAQAAAVWCDTDADAHWVRGVQPNVPVSVLASQIDPCPDPVPLRERQGVVIVADLGHDVVKGNEDAAAAALDRIVPSLRDRILDLAVTVVSDAPTPFLEMASIRSGARLVRGSEAVSVAGRSRLILDLHTYGTGGDAAVRLALQTATPFVAPPAAAGGLDLGPLAGVSLFAAPADLTFRARALLTDDARWHRVQTLLDEVVVTRFGADRRARAVRDALALVGIPASMPAQRWMDGPSGKDIRPPHRPVRVPLRPAGTRVPSPGPGTQPEDQDGRYQLWTARYGPTDAVLSALRGEIDTLPYRPAISVVVPISGPPVPFLREALESVRQQIYDRWQVCVVGAASTAPEMRAALAGLQEDPRIEVVSLDGHPGIAEATNAALEVADGEFVAFLDPGDLLKPHALAQVLRWLHVDRTLDLLYSDEDELDRDGALVEPHIKPDWSPNRIMAQNYVGRLTVVRRSVLAELGGLRPGFDGGEDHDLLLRVAERTDRIAHIPEPLYTRRLRPGSTPDHGPGPQESSAAKRALGDAAARRGRPATVGDAVLSGAFRTRYHLFGRPRVAIIVPTRDGLHLLGPCIRSVTEKSTYTNYEIVIVDNQTTDGDTLAYLARFPGRVLRYDYAFNYARIMNLAARSIDCDAFIFLNNDTEVITPGWIEALLEHGMRPEVGAVGPRLYFGDGRVQHEGIIVGQGGWACNIDHRGYGGNGEIVRDSSAVTGACTMMRPSVYWRLGGNDERLRVAYNDVDLCLRVHQAGYDVVYTPYAELSHNEGSSRAGWDHPEDGPHFGIRWRPAENVDRYYSPLFDLEGAPFRIRL